MKKITTQIINLLRLLLAIIFTVIASIITVSWLYLIIRVGIDVGEFLYNLIL